MYVAKFDRQGIIWHVTVFEKIWSEEMLSNEVKEIKSKKFLLHRCGYRWAERQICQSLFYKHRLDIIDG
jgi:hypothetical protein